MANYHGAILRYRLHIAGTCMFLSLFCVSFSFMQSYALDHERSIFEDIQLAKVAKACLVFPHGNADAEQSFSDNKNTVTAERSSLHENTITAIGLIKDGMRHSGKSASNIEVTNDMIIHRNRSVHTTYKAFL